MRTNKEQEGELGRSKLPNASIVDLKRDERIELRCACGWLTIYPPGYLQRHHRLPSDMLIFDLQYRLRCSHCRRREEFSITVTNMRAVTMNEDHPPKVIV